MAREFRYCIYQEAEKEKISVWFDMPTHLEFLDKNKIMVDRLLAGGYLLFDSKANQWHIFEHFQYQKPKQEKKLRLDIIRHMHQHNNEVAPEIKAILNEQYQKLPKTFPQKIGFFCRILACMLSNKEKYR